MGGTYHRYEEDQEFIEFHEKLAIRLNTARIGALLTQEQLGARIGISKSVLSKSENSKDPQKTPAYIVKKYAEITGQPYNYFFEEIPNIPPADVKEKWIENIHKQLTCLNEEDLEMVSGLIAVVIKHRKN